MAASVTHHPAFKWPNGAVTTQEALAVEEPLEIRLGGRHFTLTMRTPGHDAELVTGFLLAEGFISARAELGAVRAVPDTKGAPEPNMVDVVLNVPAEELRERLRRNFTVSSSCGVCGKTSIAAIEVRLAPVQSQFQVTAAELLQLPHLMRAEQNVFQATGGLHAAALFHADLADRPAGRRLRTVALREDVGRHNAVDKLIGYALMRDMIPLSDYVMMVSGRLSFELVQKAAAARVPILAAVSAPSSLAVELGEQLGLTVVGFLRDGSFNIYSHAARIVS